MDEYIKREDALDAINEVSCSDCSHDSSRDSSRDCPLCQIHPIRRKILTIPTADVVPGWEFANIKGTADMCAEVIARQDKEIEKLECRVGMLNEMLNTYALQYGTAIDKEIVLKDVKTKVVREIFTKIESLINRYYHDGWYTVSDMEHDIAELKKKYTEDK